jgi:tRNA(His) 5'-end guanylyltransferase
MFDKLGSGLKELEKASESTLPLQTPVIMRLDGKAFHTLVKKANVEKPFDTMLHIAMRDTAAALCKEIQNARFAYTQSDEISILIYESSEKSQTWFGNRVQKMVSVASSLATAVFNARGNSLPGQFLKRADGSPVIALFDARVFSVPKEQVSDYFQWRQEDCIRNSISMLAQAHFSHRKLHKKNRRDMLDMLQSKGIKWEELDDWKKRGSTIVKMWREKEGPNGEIVHRSYWDALELCEVFPPGFVQTDFTDKHLEQEKSDE